MQKEIERTIIVCFPCKKYLSFWWLHIFYDNYKIRKMIKQNIIVYKCKKKLKELLLFLSLAKNV